MRIGFVYKSHLLKVLAPTSFQGIREALRRFDRVFCEKVSGRLVMCELKSRAVLFLELCKS
jgi:hypothetical protein